MSLPKWVCYAVNGTQRERDLHEALAIAWEALKYSVECSELGNWTPSDTVKNAMTRIEKLGE